MSKKVMLVGRILVLVIIAFSLLKIPFTSEFDVSNENQGPIVTTEKSTLKKVIEKLPPSQRLVHSPSSQRYSREFTP